MGAWLAACDPGTRGGSDDGSVFFVVVWAIGAVLQLGVAARADIGVRRDRVAFALLVFLLPAAVAAVMLCSAR